MNLSEGASSYLAHRVLAVLKGTGARVRNERIALAQVKKTLARHLARDVQPDHRRVR